LENPQLVASVDLKQVAVTGLEAAETARPAEAAAAGAASEDKTAPPDRATLATVLQREKATLEHRKAELEARGGARPEPANQPVRSRTTDARDAEPAAPDVALQAPDAAALLAGPASSDGQTFRFFFRPDRTLLAKRDPASRAQQFARGPQNAFRELPDVTRQGAQEKDGTRAPGSPLRVIFVFRQSG
jgi:hypothetical protein